MRKNLVIITLTAGALLAVLFFVFHLHQTSKEEVLSQFNENQLQTTQEVARSIQRYFRSRSQDLRWLAYIASQEAFDRDKITAAIQSNFNRLKMVQIQEVSLFNENGTVVYSTTASAEGKNHSRSDFFSWAKNPGNQEAVRMWYEKTGGPRTPVTAGSPAPPQIEIFLATPLYRESAGGRQKLGGKFTGALMLTVDLEEMLAERSPLLNPATQMHKLWIIDRGGTLLVHSSHPEMVMRDIRERDKTCNGCHYSFDYIETILGKAEGTLQYRIKGEPKKVASFTPMTIDKTSWIIVMNAPLDEVTAFEWENLKETLFLLGTVAFLLGLAFFTTYRNYRQKVVGEMEVQRLRDQQKLMEKLRESEERHRTLFESSHDAIMTLAPPSWRFTTGNPATVEMFGAGDEATFTTLGPWELSPEFQPDGRPSSEKAAEMIQTAMAKGSHFFEWTHQRLGGESFPATVLLTRLEIGGQALLQATVRDITEHKQAEQTQALLVAMLDATPGFVGFADAKDTHIVYINTAGRKMVGVQAQEDVTRLKIADVHPEWTNKLFCNEIIPTAIRDGMWTGECAFLNRDGHETPVMMVLLAHKSPGGDVERFSTVSIDITERKRAMEALQESEEKYKNLIENAAEAIFVAQDGKLVFINPMTTMMIGFSSEGLMSRSFVEFIHPDDRDMVIDRHHRRVKGEELPHIYSFRIIRGDGNVIWVELNTVVVNWKGKPATLNFLNDITERNRAEQEKRSLEERLQRSEKMEALGTLAGGVAHDLNNVLGIVVGYAEMTLDEVDKSSPLRPGLVNIMNGGLKAAAIVDDLLTLARRGVPGRSILNLNKIIADCQKSPEFDNLSFHHSSVKIKTDLEPDLLNISGSSVHLGKSLYNLVSNACEAMAKGGLVTITTSNQYLDKPIHGYDQIRAGDYVVLSVSDTGEGIHEVDLKRIFEPFYTKKVMGRSGTGLGLAVVWGTVKDHNGYINVESEKGKGSTFTLYFPVTREEITAEAVSVAISEYTGNGESILVVDDVKEQRDLAAGMLRTLNYNVSSVSSGEAAVAFLKEHEVDLMVLDMIMDPGMDGLDTYKKVLEIYPKQKAIIVSGFSESDRVKTTRKLGAGAYVRKPYIKEKLGLAVRKELDRSG